MNKVLGILQNTPSVESKATSYEKRIRENIRKALIQPLEDKIAELETKIEDQLDFSLNTDLNKGINQISRPECEERIKKAITLKREKGMIELDLELTLAGFNDLFEDEQL